MNQDGVKIVETVTTMDQLLTSLTEEHHLIPSPKMMFKLKLTLDHLLNTNHYGDRTAETPTIMDHSPISIMVELLHTVSSRKMFNWKPMLIKSTNHYGDKIVEIHITMVLSLTLTMAEPVHIQLLRRMFNSKLMPIKNTSQAGDGIAVTATTMAHSLISITEEPHHTALLRKIDYDEIRFQSRLFKKFC